ncbi:MAG: diguanylate cyclase, partial [Clostridia bacterium]
ELIKNKARQLCESMSKIIVDGENAELTCSVGIAISSETVNSFAALYQNSDKALYNAKCRGRNVVSVYGEEAVVTSASKWMNGTESAFETINDSIYVCDKSSYEMIYANESLCKLMSISREACKGKKCYEVLMHRTEPCEFCLIPNMIENRVYTRFFCIPTVPRIFLMRGENINQNGTIIHLEVAVDVTDIENKNLQWSEVSGHGEK